MRRLFLSTVFGVRALSGTAQGQNPEPPPAVPPVSSFSAPSGFDSIPNPFAGSPPELLDGFSFGLTTSMVYDSDVGGGGTPLLASSEGDFIMSVAPSISYRTLGTIWRVGATLALTYDTYLENSSLGGLGYNGSVNFSYNRKPLTVTGSFGTGLSNGSNSDYNGAYVEAQTYNTSLSASYAYSPKTSLDSRFGYSWTDPDQGGFGATENINFDFTAMWRASPLIRIGPGISWSRTSGDLQSELDTLGPVVRVTYNRGSKLSFDGSFGMQFVDSGTAGISDPTFTTTLAANYRASALWSMNLSVNRGIYADGTTAGAYRESTSYRLGYNRKIRRASLGLGLAYQTSDYDSAVQGGVGDYLSFDASLGMRIIRNRVQASLFCQWSDQNGGGGSDGYRVGLSLGTQF